MMGYYVNPNGQSKEDWLRNNATRLESQPDLADIPSGHMVVCLVGNGLFNAAGICYDAEEFKAFSLPEDRRVKQWYYAPVALLRQVSNLPEEYHGD